MADEWWAWCSDSSQPNLASSVRNGFKCTSGKNCLTFIVHLNSLWRAFSTRFRSNSGKNSQVFSQSFASNVFTLFAACFWPFAVHTICSSPLRLWLFVCFIYKSHVLADGYGQIIHSISLHIYNTNLCVRFVCTACFQCLQLAVHSIVRSLHSMRLLLTIRCFFF